MQISIDHNLGPMSPANILREAARECDLRANACEDEMNGCQETIKACHAQASAFRQRSNELTRAADSLDM